MMDKIKKFEKVLKLFILPKYPVIKSITIEKMFADIDSTQFTATIELKKHDSWIELGEIEDDSKMIFRMFFENGSLHLRFTE